MPHLSIKTNVSRSSVPDDFIKTASALIAEELGKPESYCVVSIEPDTLMGWGGNKEPCAIVTLLSLGGLGPAQNVKISKKLFELFQSKLGIPNDRIYIHFIDEKPANLGYKGTTFKEIFG